MVPRPRMVSPVKTTRSSPASTRKQTESAVCPGVATARRSRARHAQAGGLERAVDGRPAPARRSSSASRGTPSTWSGWPWVIRIALDRAVRRRPRQVALVERARVDHHAPLGRRAPAAPRCWCRRASSGPGWARAPASPSPAAGRPATAAGARRTSRMRDRTPWQPDRTSVSCDAGHAGRSATFAADRGQATSTITSTSTGAPSGSSATPTALRACRPGLAEDLAEQLGRAVDHARLAGEARAPTRRSRPP